MGPLRQGPLRGAAYIHSENLYNKNINGGRFSRALSAVRAVKKTSTGTPARVRGWAPLFAERKKKKNIRTRVVIHYYPVAHSPTVVVPTVSRARTSSTDDDILRAFIRARFFFFA